MKRGLVSIALLVASSQPGTPQEFGGPDEWQQLASVWNPFADKMNKGVLDLKAWRKVVAAVDRIEHRSCK